MLARNKKGERIVILGRSAAYGRHIYTRPLLVDVVEHCNWWLNEIGLCQADDQEDVAIVVAAMKAREDDETN